MSLILDMLTQASNISILLVGVTTSIFVVASLTTIPGLSAANITVYVVNQATFWCAILPFSSLQPLDNTVILFPIAREENYDDESSPYVSTETKGLMYTLGVLYCITGFAFFIMLVRTMEKRESSREVIEECNFDWYILDLLHCHKHQWRQEVKQLEFTIETHSYLCLFECLPRIIHVSVPIRFILCLIVECF